MIHDLFKMFIQQDSSIFYVESAQQTNSEVEQSAQVCLENIREELGEDVACEQVLDEFRSNRGKKACLALDMLLLEDVILYVAESEMEALVEEFCCLTGATKVDAVTPCLTTHIVCS